MKTFFVRTLSATVYAALFLFCMLSPWRNVCFAIFAIFVAIGSAFEYFRLISIKGVHPFKTMGYLLVLCGFLCFMILCNVKDVSNIATQCSRLPLFVLVLLVTLLFLVALWRKDENVFTDIVHTFMPLLYIALPIGLMYYMVTQNNMLVLLMLLLVWINDSGAYIVGSLLGRHKLWQRHSPGKTWEGSIGGFVVALAVALLLGPVLCKDVSLIHLASIAVICSVVGTLGDLFESMLKRSVGVKDSGKIMPGHGGFLDRFDSLLAITPVVFCYSMFFELL